MLTRDCSRRVLLGRGLGAMALGVLSVCGVGMSGQEPAAGRASTVILVRHAEKDRDDPTDPGLTERGIRRAEALAKTLRAAGVTKLYATEYQRTKATLQPLSELLGLPVESYAAGGSKDFAKKLQQLSGQVVSWRKKSTPLELVAATSKRRSIWARRCSGSPWSTRISPSL